jgi:hypothetical protein
MAFSQFPPAAAGDGVAAFAASIASKNVISVHTNDFEPGVYTVTCNPTSSEARIQMLDATTILNTMETTSGAVGFTLATPATKAIITIKNTATVFPTIVTIEKTANPLTSVDAGSGTLDTINATGTYNQTGLLSVLVIGGGEFGGSSNSTTSGAGGRPGYINFDTVYTNTATTVTVGAKGVARNTNNGSDTAATNSSFGNLVVANSTPSFISGGAGGAAQGSDQIGNGNATQTFPSWNTTSTTGGGGAGAGGNSSPGGAGNGAGSGIGTGGNGGPTNGGGQTNMTGSAPGGNATGKGAGGGGGCAKGNSQSAGANQLGGDGSDGVVYVLRGF